MTNAQKLRTLLAILECAPAAQAMTVFESVLEPAMNAVYELPTSD